MSHILWFKDCSYKNKHLVGGKCSSLGELYYLAKILNFDVADGFAITTTLYDEFIEKNNLQPKIEDILNTINTEDLTELEARAHQLRELVINSELESAHADMICKHYKDLCDLFHNPNLEIAVRSSAIAEDLPNASFAGQQDTYLNIKGGDDLVIAVKKCFASCSTLAPFHTERPTTFSCPT